MSASEALRDLVVAGFFVVAVAVVWVEPVREKRRARRLAAELAEARHQADVRAARALLQRSEAQDALDAAYRLAEEQAHAAAECGQGWSMPSREQIEGAGLVAQVEAYLAEQAQR